MYLLFFKAPWCSACHAIEANVPSYAVHINCLEDEETPVKYGVNSLPLFIAINDKEEEIGRIQTTNVSVIDSWYKALEAENERSE